MNDIKEILNNKIMVFDGAMGTMLQSYNLTESDFRADRFTNHAIDLKGNNDLLCLTRPDIVEEIHKEYFESGADIVETNTFNANSISQQDYQADKFAKSFDANTFIYDPYVDIPQISLKQMFQKCDVISLHVHVTDETRYMICKDLLNLAQNDLYLINTSRGEIVNESDIVDALNNGKLTGYGTDVIENEFDDITKSPIIKAMNKGKNIIATPHIGGMTIEGQTKAYKWSINKIF